MEKQMQPMTRSEQDKMVPIDTSGASVEIELENSKDKEVAVEEENTVVEEQPVEEPSQEEPQKQEPAEPEEGQESKEASREMEDSDEEDEELIKNVKKNNIKQIKTMVFNKHQWIIQLEISKPKRGLLKILGLTILISTTKKCQILL
jgi:hypothetical protein